MYNYIHMCIHTAKSGIHSSLIHIVMQNGLDEHFICEWPEAMTAPFLP